MENFSCFSLAYLNKFSKVLCNFHFAHDWKVCETLIDIDLRPILSMSQCIPISIANYEQNLHTIWSNEKTKKKTVEGKAMGKASAARESEKFPLFSDEQQFCLAAVDRQVEEEAVVGRGEEQGAGGEEGEKN